MLRYDRGIRELRLAEFYPTFKFSAECRHFKIRIRILRKIHFHLVGVTRTYHNRSFRLEFKIAVHTPFSFHVIILRVVLTCQREGLHKRKNIFRQYS